MKKLRAYNILPLIIYLLVIVIAVVIMFGHASNPAVFFSLAIFNSVMVIQTPVLWKCMK